MKTSLLIGLLMLTSTALAGEPDPEEILRRADDIRNPAQSYRMEVQVESTRDDGSWGEPSLFEVMIQGKGTTLIKTLKPARDRGRSMLMLNEEMWAYIPNLKRAVRVALSQRLSGQAANGDISRMSWHGDYSPSFDTASLQPDAPDQWVLYLSATKKGLTYDKIRLWVEKKSFRPVKAEYLTLSGKVLKRAEYGSYQQIAGAARPTEIGIADAIRENDRSRIRIVKMEVKKFPGSLFRQESLGQSE